MKNLHLCKKDRRQETEASCLSAFADKNPNSQAKVKSKAYGGKLQVYEVKLKGYPPLPFVGETRQEALEKAEKFGAPIEYARILFEGTVQEVTQELKSSLKQLMELTLSFFLIVNDSPSYDELNNYVEYIDHLEQTLKQIKEIFELLDDLVSYYD